MPRENIIVTDGGKRSDVVCLPGVTLLDAITLCGWGWPDKVEYTARKADCPGCLAVIDHVASIDRSDYVRHKAAKP